VVLCVGEVLGGTTVLQIDEHQHACSSDEDVEHSPAKAQATGLAWKSRKHGEGRLCRDAKWAKQVKVATYRLTRTSPLPSRFLRAVVRDQVVGRMRTGTLVSQSCSRGSEPQVQVRRRPTAEDSGLQESEADPKCTASALDLKYESVMANVDLAGENR